MFNLNENNRFVVRLSATDMRKGIETLCGVVRYHQLNPLNGDVYVFSNRSRKVLKLLHWERGGFVIYNKRLEEGRISHKLFIKDGDGFRSMRWDELVLLMEGIAPGVARRKRYNLSK